MPKATHGISVTRNTENMTVTFDLMNKAEEKSEDQLTIAWDDIHEDCRDFVSLYDLTKILMDRESGTEMAEKLAAYQSCFDETLAIGKLNRDRKSGGPTVRIEVEALAKLKDMTVKQAQTLLQKYDKDQREQILTNPAITAMVEEMKAEEPAAGDLDDLL